MVDGVFGSFEFPLLALTISYRLLAASSTAQYLLSSIDTVVGQMGI